ncbi:hypothetical protein ACS0TY_032423 [Phlomoides rotata]
MENADSNCMGPQKVRKNGGPRSWKPYEELILMGHLKELVASANWKTENGFRPGYLQKVEEKIRISLPGTDLRAFPNINSKILMWKKHHGCIQLALGETGCGFNTSTKILNCSDPAWAKVLKCTTEIEQEAEDDKVSKKEEEEEIVPLSEDEEEKGKMKSEKDESAQLVPKWKRVRGLKEKMSDEIECDAWGIPKVLDRNSSTKEDCRSIQVLNHCEEDVEMLKKESSPKIPLKDPGDSKEERGRKKETLKQTLKLDQNTSLRGFDMKKKMMNLLCSREDEERKKKISKELKSEKGFEVGDEVVMYNSKLKRILGKRKLKRKWILIVKKVHHGGSLEVENSDGDIFITNDNQVKLFHPTIPKEVPNIGFEREV